MPALSSARKVAMKRSLHYGREYNAAADAAGQAESTAGPAGKKTMMPRALVRSFDAQVDLTPRLSVGTATPESIYVAEFTARIDAVAPGKGESECRIEFPLPPQIISLADVELSVDGEDSESFGLHQNRLVWQGALTSDKSSTIEVAYSATGKGIYTLEKPSGQIVEEFKTKLIANRSDIRMLELSLQPSALEQSSDKTTYTWDYQRLVVARPIAIDVLGIAAIDRLGELTWLAPVSVLVFGILISLIALAHDPSKLNGWLVVMVAGCFAGAYPLMYFLQDFISLGLAIALTAVGVIAVIGWRIISLFGLRQGVFGGVIVPAVVMALTISGTIYAKPAMQGMLMTILIIFGFVVAMVMLPRAQANLVDRKDPAPSIQ
jgi:hypothetical protein